MYQDLRTPDKQKKYYYKPEDPAKQPLKWYQSESNERASGYFRHASSTLLPFLIVLS